MTRKICSVLSMVVFLGLLVIAGFLFVCYIQVSNLLPVAVLGAGFAVYEFFNAKAKNAAQSQATASKKDEEDYRNGI